MWLTRYIRLGNWRMTNTKSQLEHDCVCVIYCYVVSIAVGHFLPFIWIYLGLDSFSVSFSFSMYALCSMCHITNQLFCAWVVWLTVLTSVHVLQWWSSLWHLSSGSMTHRQHRMTASIINEIHKIIFLFSWYVSLLAFLICSSLCNTLYTVHCTWSAHIVNIAFILIIFSSNCRIHVFFYTLLQKIHNIFQMFGFRINW